MVRYLILFGYIGTRYKGLQLLPQFVGETVQGIIEEGLKALEPLNHPKTVTCSRTDKGVHAFKNALHVDLEHPILKETFHPHKITKSLNLYLQEKKHDIVVSKTCIVPDNFHARHPQWRSYVYRLAVLKRDLKGFSMDSNSYIEFLPGYEINRCAVAHCSLDPDRVQEATELFCGTHDFRTFTSRLYKEGRDPVKTLFEVEFYPIHNGSVSRDSQSNNIDMWEFYIRGNAFLYHQVRKMVGTLISYGYRLLTLDQIQDMLDDPSPNKWVKATLPPSCGLYLADIHYDFKCENRINEAFL